MTRRAGGEKLPEHVEVLTDCPSQPFVHALYEISTESHFWFEWRLAATRALLREHRIPTDRKLRVLEIGTGAGVLRRQLEALTHWQIDSTDLDLDILAQHRGFRGRTMFYDVRDRRPELAHAYDLIILFDVLEHIEVTEDFLAASLHHLAPSGHLLIDVPALQLFFSDFDRAAGHHRRYDRKSLAAEMRPFEGFAVQTLRYWGFLMLPLLLVRNLAILRARNHEDAIHRGFAPPSPIADRLLRGLMRLDRRFFSKPLCGTSLLLLGQQAPIQAQ